MILNKKKGQYLSLEQMFLFSIGAIICISVIISFNFIRGNVRDGSLERQSKKIGQVISSAMSEVYRTSYESDYVNMTIDIPIELSNEIYVISIDETEEYLNILYDQKEINVDIINIKEEIDFDTDEYVSSAMGSINIIYKKNPDPDENDKIKLDR